MVPQLRTLTCSLLLASTAAYANGGIPDSLSLFAPEDEPKRIVLSTNFGLIETTDGAQTWHIFCEAHMKAPNGFLYQFCGGPDHRLTALSLDGLGSSDDNMCTWELSDGGIPTVGISDDFMDPSNCSHVLAIDRVPDGGGLPPQGIYESMNGSGTFSSVPLFLSPTNSFITGVEVAAAQPNTYYATMYISVPLFRPFVLRSDDRGAHWIQNELTPSLGNTSLRLLAVDPIDPSILYLRLVSPTGIEGIGVAYDGGAIASTLYVLAKGQRVTAFVRRRSGDIAFCQGPDPGGCFETTDAGGRPVFMAATFLPFLQYSDGGSVHARAIAERDGGLIVAGQNYRDGFAAALVLDDGGVESLLTYQALTEEGSGALAQCGGNASDCAPWWTTTQCILNPCAAPCPNNPCLRGDGGATGDGGAVDAGPPPGGNCRCSDTPFAPWLLLMLVAALWAGSRR